ncbi:hypothetical protein [Dysgonomonas sp. BGC7]|uniref:endonuclease/exonuclease/phosphatase family protein n=1 Tax=Dysgonomonas sp. BGC7 TaxID=1658008 RepID=UPI001F55874F|nr:hypothetical protein [Dysgonomonas sp. BGC7]
MNGASKSIFLLPFLFFLSGQISHAQERFRVMFYNTENLYDTKNNPNTSDDDLTPEGNLRWNKYRYWKKLHDISKVISSVGSGHPPALVGLCEVENDSVLFDLTKRAALQRHKYEYIITNSKDSRGSNVALLYQRDQIKIIGTKSYTPVIYETQDSVVTTRDILHVTGKVVNGETIDIFICHFPSRSKGIKKSRPYRITCAKLLRQKTDSLFSIRKRANIIIMGDFNDYPYDTSIKDTLNTFGTDPSPDKSKLYNLFYHQATEKKEDTGSYKYRGKWNYIDQFIVSGNLLNINNISIKENTAHVYNADFLLETDNNKYGGSKPFRTYSGYKYLGGFSDHLPIYFDLLIKEN